MYQAAERTGCRPARNGEAETHTHLGACLFKLPDGALPDYVPQLYNRWRRHPVDRPPFNHRLSGAWLAKLRPAWEILDDVHLGQHLFHIALPYQRCWPCHASTTWRCSIR